MEQRDIVQSDKDGDLRKGHGIPPHVLGDQKSSDSDFLLTFFLMRGRSPR